MALSFFFGFGLDGAALERGGPEMYLPVFLLYVVTYTIGIFFQAAVVAGATERMRGGDPTVGSALSAAGRRLGPIVLWAIVAATAGMIIRAIHDRVGFVGKIIASLVGAAWSLGTFFVVPVLVLEDRSIPDSFNRSVSVFKQTWGETVAGGTGIGIATICAWLALVAVVGLLSFVAGVAALLLGAVGAIFLMIFFGAARHLRRVAVSLRDRRAYDVRLRSGAARSGVRAQEQLICESGTPLFILVVTAGSLAAPDRAGGAAAAAGACTTATPACTEWVMLGRGSARSILFSEPRRRHAQRRGFAARSSWCTAPIATR